MGGVLVDTSVWIDHFRRRNAALEALLSQDLAWTHPMVIGELACGTPPSPRSQTLHELGLLPTIQHASLRETIALIEREALHGLGCGLVDLILLTSTLLSPGVKLWPLDHRLAKLAARFGVAHQFP